MESSAWVVVLVVLLGSGCIIPAADAIFEAQVSLSLSTLFDSSQLKPVNRRLIGNNCQWVDQGDGLVKPSGGAGDVQQQTIVVNPTVYDRAVALKPGILRYPGGLFSDIHDWRAGVGNKTIGSRGALLYNPPVLDYQQVIFGTQEFLELCEATGAEPLFTVNLMTGTAQEAADWVRLVNVQRLRSSVTGNLLPKVTFWEIGNEPYYEIPSKYNFTTPTPAQSAARINAWIPAMKAVDPTIQVGIPLKSNTINGIGATGWYPTDYLTTVLTTVNVSWDFACLHDAYLPVAVPSSYTDEELYVATMASIKTVEHDMNFTRSQIGLHQPGVFAAFNGTIPFAHTEYGNLMQDLFYSSTFMSALYVADLLMFFAQRDDVVMANYWSLTGDGMFGTVWTDGVRRPVYPMLHTLSTLFEGYYLPLSIDTPTFSSPSVFYTEAQSAVPLVSGMATTATTPSGAQRVRVLLINKHYTDAANITVFGSDPQGFSLLQQGLVVELKVFYHENVTDRWTFYDDPGAVANIDWVTVLANTTLASLPINTIMTSSGGEAAGWVVTMPPHSAVSIEVEVYVASSEANRCVGLMIWLMELLLSFVTRL